MTTVDRSWKILPHRPVERLGDDLWTVTGTLPRGALRRVMTLVRLPDRRVVVHSAIALEEAAMAQVEAWGTPSVLVVPNRFHRLDAPAYLARYPGLEVLCPRGARRAVERVVPVAGDLDALAGGTTLEAGHLDGTREAEGYLLHRGPAGATLVLNDAVFNMGHGRGVAGLVFRHVTASTGGPRVSRLFRWFAVRDRAAFRAHLARLADTPGLVRVIVSHHRPIADDAAGVLRRVAAEV